MARRIESASTIERYKKKENLTYSAWIEVNLDHVLHNLRQIEKHSSAPILPILKSDAYGHGAPALAVFLEQHGWRRFGVSALEEAKPILKATKKAALLLLTPPLPNQLPLVIRYGLIPAVSTYGQIVDLASEAERARKTIKVHLKVDTGLGRLGASPQEVEKLALEIKKRPSLQLEGVFTHFAAAFDDQKFTSKQLERFLQLRKGLIAQGYTKLLWHAANSAALIAMPASHLDLVRIGTLLYGQSPIALDKSWDLKPTWLFKTKIVQIRQLSKGETIGYGKNYKVSRPMNVGVIPVGYSHGLEMEPHSEPWRQLKHLLAEIVQPRTSPVIYHGNPLPILGRIGMGLTCLDLSRAPELKVGDEVVILMRRATAAKDLPKIFLSKGKIKYIYENLRLRKISLY